MTVVKQDKLPRQNPICHYPQLVTFKGAALWAVPVVRLIRAAQPFLAHTDEPAGTRAGQDFAHLPWPLNGI
jgi:hypothetical protein